MKGMGNPDDLKQIMHIGNQLYSSLSLLSRQSFLLLTDLPSMLTVMFQYKIIHNVLPTRATLYRDGISENPICNLCNAEEQTLHHLLINCTLTVDFWILFQDWWFQKNK